MMEPKRLKFIVICGSSLIYVMALIFVIYYTYSTQYHQWRNLLHTCKNSQKHQTQ